MGLGKDRRIGDSKSFERLFKQARLLKNPQYLIRVLKSPLGTGRLAVLISKKLIPRAADRHRLKRLCQEAFRQSPAWNSPMDYLITLRSALREKEDVETFLQGLKQDFKRLAKP